MQGVVFILLIVGGCGWCGFVVSLPILVMIGATILRSSVSVANWCLLPKRDDYNSAENREESEEYRPRRKPVRPRGKIPEPQLAWSVIIFTVATIATGVVGTFLGFLLRFGDIEPEDSWPIIVPGIGFLALSGSLYCLLPTTLKRASLVAAFMYLITGCIAVAAVLLSLIVAHFAS